MSFPSAIAVELEQHHLRVEGYRLDLGERWEADRSVEGKPDAMIGKSIQKCPAFIDWALCDRLLAV